MANTTTINQSGINFTVDNRVNQYTGWEKKYSNATNLGGSTYPDPDEVNETTGIAAFGINAVEIDWNDAQWPNTTPSAPTTIKTTADLIKAVKYASTVWNAANDVALKH